MISMRLGSIREGVVWAVQDGILAEHGRHNRKVFVRLDRFQFIIDNRTVWCEAELMRLMLMVGACRGVCRHEVA